MNLSHWVNNMSKFKLSNRNSSQCTATIKVGDKFPNKNIEPDETVEVIGYGGSTAVKVQFPDGSIGYGSTQAVRRGTIKPESK